MGQVTFKTPAEIEQENLDNWRASARVSKFQAKAALKGAGLLEQVSQMMAVLPEDDLTRLAWEDAQEFRRESPTILAFASQLDLSEEEIDDLFKSAANIEA